MGKRAVPEAHEPVRETDTGRSLMLCCVTSVTRREEDSAFCSEPLIVPVTSPGLQHQPDFSDVTMGNHAES